MAKLLREAGHAVALKRLGTAPGVGPSSPLEDMCADCKRAHVKEWEAEMLGKALAGQMQRSKGQTDAMSSVAVASPAGRELG